MRLPLQTEFDPRHGIAVPVGPSLLRITAPNAGAMTFTGTNSYLAGTRRLVAVDPGPADETHWQALLRAIDGRPVDAVLLTHSHLDHAALARRLADEVGAPVVAARRRESGTTSEPGSLDAATDHALRIDVALADGEAVPGGDAPLVAVATPGHTSDHLAFDAGGGIVLSGDHVMGWATSVVAPPDGRMADYLGSLDRLLARRDDRLYLPGHGGAVERPHHLVRALRSHRRMRERTVLARLGAGDRTVAEIVAAIYRDLSPGLRRAAALSVLAHLEHLAENGLVVADPGPAAEAVFRLA